MALTLFIPSFQREFARGGMTAGRTFYLAALAVAMVIRLVRCVFAGLRTKASLDYKIDKRTLTEMSVAKH